MRYLSQFGRRGGLCTLLLLPLAAAAGAAPSLSFELRTVKQQYVIGEPVVAILTLRGSADLYDMGPAELCDQASHFRFLVDRGQGFTRFVRKRISAFSGEGQKTHRGDESYEYVLSYDAAIEDWFLPTAGTVRLMAEYEDPDVGLIRSAPATFEAKTPEGDEKIVHDAIRALPGLGPRFLLELDTHNDTYLNSEREAALAEQYPRSVYLQGPRERDLGYRLSHISSRANPDDRWSPAPQDRREREELVRQRRLEFLPEAEALADDLQGGQFEPDALVTLAGLYAATGNEERAQELYARVIRDFPDRAAAEGARREIDDTEAPVLTVSVRRRQ